MTQGRRASAALFLSALARLLALSAVVGVPGYQLVKSFTLDLHPVLEVNPVARVRGTTTDFRGRNLGVWQALYLTEWPDPLKYFEFCKDGCTPSPVALGSGN
jgi:hypothetical protein